MRHHLFTSVLIAFILAPLGSANARVDTQNDRTQKMIDKGLAFLKTQQKPNGAWHNEKEPPGISALVLRAFAANPKPDPDSAELVRAGFANLVTYQKADGGIYVDMHANYNTAISVSALAAGAGDDPHLKESLDRAIDYLRHTQWGDGAVGPEGETVPDKSNNWFGGFGYGRHSRPDLSNTQFSVQALHDAGLKPEDPAYQKALVFLTRSQNFSETNDQPWSGTDGGFVYTPANGGDSEAESYTAPDGRKMWRSYGSMTYAGLKSMVFAGLTKDDPRVKAAFDWITNNWTVDQNPGMGVQDPANAQHGLYYYYQVMAKSLHAYGEPVIADAKGTKHDWRMELLEKLESLQKPDGSWSGEKRWMEDNPILVTAYVVIALEEIQKDLELHRASGK